MFPKWAKLTIGLAIVSSLTLLAVSWRSAGSSQEATAAAAAESPWAEDTEHIVAKMQAQQREKLRQLQIQQYLESVSVQRYLEAKYQEQIRRIQQQHRVYAAQAAPAVRASYVSGDVWERLARCESGMTNANTGNGFYGYFQFTLSTWHGMGMAGSPTDYDYGTQKSVAQRLQARSGWGQWPACSRKLGLR